MDRRLLPEHQLPSQQKRGLERKVADLVHHAARFGMVTGTVAIDMGARAAAQTRHGRGPDRHAPGACTRRAAPN